MLKLVLREVKEKIYIYALLLTLKNLHFLRLAHFVYIDMNLIWSKTIFKLCGVINVAVETKSKMWFAHGKWKQWIRDSV